MALPVPRRKLRPAPYATCCCGGAPVPVRRLPRRPMFKVDATVEAPLPDVLGTITPACGLCKASSCPQRVSPAA